MMKSNKKFDSNIANIIFVVILLCILTLVGINRSQKLSNDPRYTIGTVKNFQRSRGGPDVIYEYYVNRKRYTGINTVDAINKSFRGRLFFVKYSKSNPKASEILFEYPVPDTLKTIPEGGWEKIPIFSF